MTRPRKALVSIETTRYYHVMSRCVRRAFLCGKDDLTGRDFSHRREWIEARIHILSSIFGIDICSYAVMSNHYHITLRLSPEQIKDLDRNEICERWQCLYNGTLLFQRYCRGESLSKVELDCVLREIEVYRERLCNLGWFMKCLNEPLARMANREDKITGTFWEHRYKSQALCSEEALLSAMAYVDLNPIRACMADTPEESDHTAIKHRIAEIRKKPTIDLGKAIAEQYTEGWLQTDKLELKPLLAFNPNKQILHEELPFSEQAYLDLFDWTGRIVRNDKRGSIKQSLPPILERLAIEPNRWIASASKFEALHRWRFGNPHSQSSAA